MTLKPYYAAEASSLLFKKTYVIYTLLKKMMESELMQSDLDLKFLIIF